jgi:hypothetical protein
MISFLQEFDFFLRNLTLLGYSGFGEAGRLFSV